MSTYVQAPVAGTIMVLRQVPDQVFADEVVGPGLALDPSGTGVIDVYAPVTGVVAVHHPHAFVIETAGMGILVHLGIDTVTLQGAPFRSHIARGDQVTAGQHILTWNLAGLGALSPIVPVIALGATSIGDPVAAGSHCAAGAEIFTATQP